MISLRFKKIRNYDMLRLIFNHQQMVLKTLLLVFEFNLKVRNYGVAR